MTQDPSSLRQRIYGLFPESSELEAFLVDFFPDVYAKTNAAMTKVALVSQLLVHHDPATIARALDRLTGDQSGKPERRLLREHIAELCPTDDDVEAFSVDFFPSAWAKTSAGMTRTAKLSLLLQLQDPQELGAALVRWEKDHLSAKIPQAKWPPPRRGDPASAEKRSKSGDVTHTISRAASAAPTQISPGTDPQNISDNNKLVHTTLLENNLEFFDLLAWEHPYPERFGWLRKKRDNSQQSREQALLRFNRTREGLILEAQPTLLISGDEQLKSVEERVLKSRDGEPIRRTYFYAPDGKRVGVRYLLRIIGEVAPINTLANSSETGWRWIIEFSDTTALPHLYLRFLWSD